MKGPIGTINDRQGYEFGEFRLDACRRQLLLKADGRVLPLQSKAFDILLVFAQHQGELLDKETLMKAVWPNVVVEENNLNQGISAVRRVLGDSREEPRFIVTVPGRGYKFVAGVSVLPDGAAKHSSSTEPSSQAPAPRPEQPVAAPPAQPAHAEPAAVPLAVWPHAMAKPPNTLRWVGIGAALLVAGGIAWFVTRRAEVADEPKPAAKIIASDSVVAPHELRLAVMPFTNLSPDASNTFFADGLHEEVLSTLAGRLSSVAVISRTTMLNYQQKPKPIAEVSRELGATHVMEGTVRREGNRVRLTLQLVDAGTDRYLWSQTYDRTLASAMTLQSEVAADVATQLSVRLAGGVASRSPITRDPQAYDLYLQGLLALRGSFDYSPAGFRERERPLDAALARDPNFALAYAQRARVHTLMLMTSADTSDRNYRSISADLAAAERLAPNDPTVRAAYGFFMLADGQYLRSIEAIEWAEAAGLQDPVVLSLLPKTRALLNLGRVDEAVRVHERMLELDPANPLVLGFAALHLLLVQRPDEALRVAKLTDENWSYLAEGLRAYVQLGARGDPQGLHKVNAEAIADRKTRVEDPKFVARAFEMLRYERRYADLVELLQQVPARPARFEGDFLQILDCVGKQPPAQFLGWAYLLVAQRAKAEAQGQAVIAFVAQQPETRLNDYFLRLLAASGYTFLGQKQRAVAAAREALDLMPRSRNAVAWVGAASIAARVYAWNGEEDEAVKLLEQLALAAPGLPPGFIAKDPLYTLPLAHNARFQSLLARLDEQMRHSSI